MVCIFLFLTTSKSKTWTKCLTVFYFKVFKFYFELIESLLCLLVVDDKFNGFNVSVCHNKNDALILVFPKISASLSDKTKTECVFISFSSLAYRMVVDLHICPTIFLLEADNSLFPRNWLQYLR